jgi:alpha-mannosidase
VGNLLSLYHDHPNDWDAWDVDLSYEKCLCETACAVRVRRLPGGAVRQGLDFSLTVGRSDLRQIVRLAQGSKRLDLETTVDWREKHKMLRVSFPVSVRSERAGFDVQFGFVFRPTHRNTSWDQARFEVAAHRYADLSDSDYGVALLNDCKYGHKVVENTLDLCLLRAPTYPDPDADQGEHHFTYSLLPHRGDLAHSEVISQASLLNAPPALLAGRGAPASGFPWELRAEGLSCEAFKKAEREEALILRLVETQGRRVLGELRLRDPEWTVTTVDLMERPEGEPLPHTGFVPLTFEPFEIRTFKLSRTEDGRDG